jgi:hypothetical protein
MAKEHRWSTTAGEGGEMPVVLKRWSVPTGEPDNTERVPSGSVGGWGKRSVSYLARSLPNLLRRSSHRARLTASVDLIGIANGCAKRTYKSDFWRNLCVNHHYFLICTQGKS